MNNNDQFIEENPFGDDVADQMQDAPKSPINEVKEETGIRPQDAPKSPINEVKEETGVCPQDAPKSPNLASEGQIKLLEEIFRETKIDFSIDDPIIVALLSNHRFINEVKESFRKDLKIHNGTLQKTVDSSLKNGLQIFDERFQVLQQTLDKLENHKEHIIGEIYTKSKINIQETLSKELTEQVKILMQQASNKNNNTKFLLQGAILGGLVSFVIFAAFIVIIGIFK